MRRVVAIAVLVSLLAAGVAEAATPKSPLAAYGDHLYGEYCLRCHSTGLAPSLHGVGALAADFYLRTGLMPLRRLGMEPVPRTPRLLGDYQIRALVAYIASFGGPPIPKPNPSRGSLSQGLSLFTEHCAGCHQVVAQGGYVTGALPPPLTQGTTDLEVAEAVRIGPYVMPKFSRRAISDRQLDSIIRYVDYANRPYHPGGWGLDFLGPVPEGLVTWFIAIPLLLGLCLLIGKRYSSS
jgi:ubiquinol-cytochrome c reductase cytochrome c subunit